MTNGWQTVQLGKVMQVEIDAVPVDNQPEFHMAGVYSFARGLFKREPLPNTQTTYKVFHRLHKDMFVISVPKGWEGALARVTDDFDGMFLSPVYPTFRANPKELDIRYFEWYCRQSKVWDELRRKSRGIGARRESISAEQFLTLEIPLPPLTEQRRIVAHIESLAARVNDAQHLRAKADEETEFLWNSAIKFACEGRIDLGSSNDEHALNLLENFRQNGLEQRIKRKPKEKQKSVNDFKLPNLPEGWVWVVLGEVGLDISDGNYAGKYPKTADFVEKGIPFIRATNLRNDYFINPGDMRYISEELHEELQRGHLLLNDILVVTRGDIGKVAIVTEPFVGCNINAQLVRINTGTLFNPKFFLYALNSDTSKRQFAVLKTGTSLAQLPVGKLRQLSVPLPPLDEQRRIVAYLDGLQAKVNALRELQSKSGEELSALMPSVLDKAFKGEL